jgi:hypothetical protein
MGMAAVSGMAATANQGSQALKNVAQAGAI